MKITVANFIHRIMDEWDVYPMPEIIKYKSNTYYLKHEDYMFIGYYTKSGIDLKDRIDVYNIYEEDIEIVKE